MYTAGDVQDFPVLSSYVWQATTQNTVQRSMGRLVLRRRYVSNIGVKDERAVHHLGAELLGSQALVLPVCEKRLWRVP